MAKLRKSGAFHRYGIDKAQTVSNGPMRYWGECECGWYTAKVYKTRSASENKVQKHLRGEKGR